MATVKDLIDQLNTIKEKDQPIVFQYLLCEHTDLSMDEFEERAEALDYTDFADEMSIVMNEWLSEMERV